MGGFYYSDNNHIDIVDHYYLIRILSLEMRHAFQYLNFPDLFFATEYKSVREYLKCEIERDARGYSLDYCTVREYWEEAAYIRDEEKEFELVIQKNLSPNDIELNESYFILNPTVASSVPRDYHWNRYYNQDYAQIEIVNRVSGSLGTKLVGFFQMVLGCAIILVIALLILGFLVSLF